MSSLYIVKPGMQTTIQDLGRWGWQRYGVSVSGAMDARAHRLANALVSNGASDATLEVAIVGPEIEFEAAAMMAVTGARFALTLDGVAVPMDEPVAVGAGARLAFGPRQRGARAYVAIAGGIATQLVLGSRSTHVASRIGGLDGRALRAGDRLPLAAPDGTRPFRRLRMPSELTFDATDAADSTQLHVIVDSHAEGFVPGALEALQSAPYVVGYQSDRIGYRLEGPVVGHLRQADMVSSITPVGTLQVPASGQPILLMADRQTTGGYATIAHVVSADIPRAAQLAPGDRLRFVPCTSTDARSRLMSDERMIRAVESQAVA